MVCGYAFSSLYRIFVAVIGNLASKENEIYSFLSTFLRLSFTTMPISVPGCINVLFQRYSFNVTTGLLKI